MSIITDQTVTNPDFQNIANNCVGTLSCYPYIPQATYTPPHTKLTIEAVDGGFVIDGYFPSKGVIRTVAVDAAGLAEIVKRWCKQEKKA